MKCAVHPTVETETVCSSCNKALCEACNLASGGEKPLCSRCLALNAISDFSEEEENRERVLELQREAAAQKASRKRRLQIMTVAFAFFLVPVQLLVLAMNEPPPPVLNLSDPEEVTEACILNLFRIADLLQSGQTPPFDFRCPASPDPYIITYTGSDIIVDDPHPELHGYSRMRVSKNNPFPEIVE